MTGNSEQNTSELLQRILETVTWCKHKADITEPRTCLRTPELKPDEYVIKSEDNIGFNIHRCEQAQTLLADLARKRRELVQNANLSVTPSAVNRDNGRFMLHILSNSIDCGLSEYCSDGFFDVIDLPPWDTWIACLKGSCPWGRILSWVPTVFCELTDKGMDAEAVGCIFWASEYRQKGYSSDVLDWLESQGLLF